MKIYWETNLSFGDDGYQIYLCFQVLPYQYVWKRSTLTEYKMQSFTTLQMPFRLLMELCHKKKLVNENSSTHCSFFAGKSRVAHVKQMTIPRLELSAALLAVRMNQTLQEEFQTKVDKRVIWSDFTVSSNTSRAKRQTILHVCDQLTGSDTW